MAITPEKEAAFVELLKTEYLLLVGAALGACHTGDTAGLFKVLKMLPAASQHPKFKPMLAEVEAARAEQAKRADELLKGEPKKSTGPSPWGYGQ